MLTLPNGQDVVIDASLKPTGMSFAEWRDKVVLDLETSTPIKNSVDIP